MTTLYTKADFARLIGRSPGFITQHISKGNIVLTQGTNKIDITHPTNRATAIRESPQLDGFLPAPQDTHRTERQEGSTETRGRRKAYQGDLVQVGFDPIPKGDPIHALRDRVTDDVAVEDLLNMTLQQIYRRFGTIAEAISYIDAVKKIEDIVYKQTKTAAERGQLVSRDSAMKVIAAWDSANARMLSDAPATIAGLVHTQLPENPDNPTKEDIEGIVREPMSKELATAKNKVQRTIRRDMRVRVTEASSDD